MSHDKVTRMLANNEYGVKSLWQKASKIAFKELMKVKPEHATYVNARV